MATAAGGHAERDADRYRALKTAYDDLERRHAELLASYYFSGARKKIDISSLPGFGEIASRVRAEGRAGMHDDRLYTLWQAVQRAPDGLPVVEVGAYQGGSAKFVAESFRARGQAPHFYVCDTFSGHARTDDARDDIRHRTRGKFLDTSAARVGEYLAGYPNVELVVGDILETAPARFASVPAFALVHVDVDVYPPTEFCLRFFAPRLAPGALLVVDDYGFTTCPGAKAAVDEFVAAHREFTMVHLLSGQALVFRAG